MRVSFAAVVSLVLLALPVGAAELYVATTGSDSNPGTLSAPLKTINKASSLAKAGDVVTVRGGTYAGPVEIGARGTASARIVFRAYPGEKPVIDGTGLASGKILVNLYRTEYIDFSGFEVANAPYIAINGYAARHTRVAGNDIHHAYRNGIYFGYSSFGSSSDITIEGNTVRNNVLENQNRTLNGGWAGAVVVARTDRARITGNRVHQNDGEGIIALLSDNVVIDGNQVWDNFSVGIYLDNAQSATVDSNLVYSTGDSRYFRNGYPAAGISTANETYSDSNPSSDLTITNNIVVNTRWGFHYGSYESGGGLRNVVVAHNTFYRSANAIVSIDTDTHSASTIENNIFHQVGSSSSPVYGGGGVTFRHNNWYGGSAGVAAGTGDVYGDPLFVNTGGTRAEDYKLTSGSAALQVALDNATLTRDFFGAARSASYDIGAHELSVGSVSADTQAPAAPANLRLTGSTTSVALAWDAATDNVAVTGYKVFRNGALHATVTGTSHTDTTQPESDSWHVIYYVRAFDAAGNESPSSNTIGIAASPAQPADEVSPDAPTGVHIIRVTKSWIDVAWTAASDNVGVTEYHVYRDGRRIATTAALAWRDRTTTSVVRTYYVVAADAAGNVSLPSSSVSSVAVEQKAEAPSGVTNLRSRGVTPVNATIAWDASAEHEAVTAYRVFRDGVQIGTTAGNAWTDTSLKPRTTYVYTVVAVTATGAASPQSSALTVTTPGGRRRAA